VNGSILPPGVTISPIVGELPRVLGIVAEALDPVAVLVAEYVAEYPHALGVTYRLQTIRAIYQRWQAETRARAARAEHLAGACASEAERRDVLRYIAVSDMGYHAATTMIGVELDALRDAKARG